MNLCKDETADPQARGLLESLKMDFFQLGFIVLA